MNGFIQTHKGMEAIAATEVGELIGQKAATKTKLATFPIKSYEDLFLLSYRSQSAIKVGFLLSQFSSKDLKKDIEAAVEKIQFSEWVGKDTTIAIRCKKEIEKPSTAEIEKALSSAILAKIKKEAGEKQPVDLKNPDITFVMYVLGNECFLGIDFSGDDLSKRSYHIFTHPASIKGTIAYGIVRLSGFEKKGIFLDCFSGAGTIPFEAYFFASGFPVRYFDADKFPFKKFPKFKDIDFNKFFEEINKKISKTKTEIYNADSSMKYIQFAKKNAKIAGIQKELEFRRMSVEWLDTKFNKAEVDYIVSKLPQAKTKDTEEHYKQLFYHAEFILKKKGIMLLLGREELIKKYALKYNFQIKETHEFFSGQESYICYKIVKK